MSRLSPDRERQKLKEEKSARASDRFLPFTCFWAMSFEKNVRTRIYPIIVWVQYSTYKMSPKLQLSVLCCSCPLRLIIASLEVVIMMGIILFKCSQLKAGAINSFWIFQSCPSAKKIPLKQHRSICLKGLNFSKFLCSRLISFTSCESVMTRKDLSPRLVRQASWSGFSLTMFLTNQWLSPYFSRHCFWTRGSPAIGYVNTLRLGSIFLYRQASRQILMKNRQISQKIIATGKASSSPDAIKSVLILQLADQMIQQSQILADVQLAQALFKPIYKFIIKSDVRAVPHLDFDVLEEQLHCFFVVAAVDVVPIEVILK